MSKKKLIIETLGYMAVILFGVIEWYVLMLLVAAR